MWRNLEGSDSVWRTPDVSRFLNFEISPFSKLNLQPKKAFSNRLHIVKVLMAIPKVGVIKRGSYK